MEAQRAIALRLMEVAMGKSGGEVGGALGSVKNLGQPACLSQVDQHG